MKQEKLKQLANSYNLEIVVDLLKDLQSEIADIRIGDYSLEARKANIEIVDNLLKRLRMYKEVKE